MNKNRETENLTHSADLKRPPVIHKRILKQLLDSDGFVNKSLIDMDRSTRSTRVSSIGKSSSSSATPSQEATDSPPMVVSSQSELVLTTNRSIITECNLENSALTESEFNEVVIPRALNNVEATIDPSRISSRDNIVYISGILSKKSASSNSLQNLVLCRPENDDDISNCSGNKHMATSSSNSAAMGAQLIACRPGTQLISSLPFQILRNHALSGIQTRTVSVSSHGVNKSTSMQACGNSSEYKIIRIGEGSSVSNQIGFSKASPILVPLGESGPMFAISPSQINLPKNVSPGEQPAVVSFRPPPTTFHTQNVTHGPNSHHKSCDSVTPVLIATKPVSNPRIVSDAIDTANSSSESSEIKHDLLQSRNYEMTIEPSVNREMTTTTGNEKTMIITPEVIPLRRKRGRPSKLSLASSHNLVSSNIITAAAPKESSISQCFKNSSDAIKSTIVQTDDLPISAKKLCIQKSVIDETATNRFPRIMLNCPFNHHSGSSFDNSDWLTTNKPYVTTLRMSGVVFNSDSSDVSNSVSPISHISVLHDHTNGLCGSFFSYKIEDINSFNVDNKSNRHAADLVLNPNNVASDNLTDSRELQPNSDEVICVVTDANFSNERPIRQRSESVNKSDSDINSVSPEASIERPPRRRGRWPARRGRFPTRRLTHHFSGDRNRNESSVAPYRNFHTASDRAISNESPTPTRSTSEKSHHMESGRGVSGAIGNSQEHGKYEEAKVENNSSFVENNNNFVEIVGRHNQNLHFATTTSKLRERPLRRKCFLAEDGFNGFKIRERSAKKLFSEKNNVRDENCSPIDYSTSCYSRGSGGSYGCTRAASGTNFISDTKKWIATGSSVSRSLVIRGKNVIRTFFYSIERSGLHLRVGDSVLLHSSGDSDSLPFIGRIAALWVQERSHSADNCKTNSTTLRNGTVMTTVLWYYRPHQTENVNKPELLRESELFVSTHVDDNPASCIMEKCFVLSYSEYCRYSALRAMKKYVPYPPTYDPRPFSCLRSGNCNKNLPSLSTDSQQIFFADRLCDFKSGRVLKKIPLILPNGY